MKIGQTSFIMFVSKLVGSALGFLATVYFARELGAEVLGVYTLVITIVGWLLLVSEIGIGKATTKRISEREEQGKFLSATVIWVTSLAIVFSIGVILLQPFFEQYVGEFGQYVSISVIWFIIALLFVRLFFKTTYQVLKGQRLVHIVGILNPVQVGGISLIQVVLVFLGYGLLGMLIGSIIGGIVVGLIGIYWIAVRPARPSKRHFKSLFDYAKFSWLGSLRSRTFNEVDILLLGVFAQPALIGIYSVSWSIAKFLELFGNSIGSSMFPEISYTSAQKAKEEATELVEDSLAFAGLIAIPGFVGGAILAERLLQIYGPEFVRGATILALLILAILLSSYLQQLMNGLNGIDRPDLSFRINAVFIILNAGLNVILIPLFSIEGAATASVISVTLTLGFAYYTLRQQMQFQTPIAEISRQIISALLMGAVIITSLELIERTGFLRHNFALVLLLIAAGAGIYFLTLLGISHKFRSTVVRNLPDTILIVSN